MTSGSNPNFQWLVFSQLYGSKIDVYAGPLHAVLAIEGDMVW